MFSWDCEWRPHTVMWKNGLYLIILLVLSQASSSASHTKAGHETAHPVTSLNRIESPKDSIRLLGLKKRLCDHVSITTNSARIFLDKLQKKKANFAYLRVKSENRSLISWSKTSEALYESVWIWTFLGEGGAFPYVWYSADFYSASSGILDKYTAHGITLNVSTNSLTPCHVEMGAPNSTQTIANAFNAMMETAYASYSTYKHSVFCYTVKYQSYGPVLYYLTHLLGIEKGYLGYKCCYQKEDPLNHTRTTSECEQRIQKMTKWYCILYMLVLLSFFYGPVVICSVVYRFTVLDDIESMNSLIDGYKPIPSGNCQDETSVERWIYLGVDKPITLRKVSCRVFSVFKACPVLTSRFQRMIVLLLTPAVICFRLYLHARAWESRWIYHRLLADVPVGFLALPFGFEASRKNWGYLFGGPYVMYSVFFSLGLIMFLLPRSFCHVMTSRLRSGGRHPRSLLSLDVFTLEAWGNTTFSHLIGYNFVCKVVTANFYMLLNLNFWIFVKDLFLSRINGLNKRLRKCFGEGCLMHIVFRFVQFILFILYSVVYIVELAGALVYYALPAVFLSITLLRGYNYWIWQHVHGLIPRILVGIIVTVLTAHNLIAFAILYLCSAIYIIEAIDFTYVGVIIYPSFTVGYVIGAGTLAYYLVGNIRKFNDTFSELLELTVAASTNLETRRRKSICKVEDDAIILSSDYAAGIHCIKVAGEISVTLSDIQEKQLKSCGQLGRLQSLIKWRDNQPGIPYKLFLYVMQRYCPLRVHVFWFLFRLAVFCLVVVSITTLLASYNISRNLALPAQIITAVSLNVLPRIMELCVSKLDIRLAHEHYKRCLETTVEEYWKSNDCVTHDRSPTGN